jgi:beta-lactamase regulating signal transducer with metallopeptidase domain
MIAAFDLNAIAQASTMSMVNVLLEGTLIAAFAALVLQVGRRQDSGTRFAVGFSALMLIAAVPWIGVPWSHGSGVLRTASARSEILLPASWALYLFAAWGAMATIGLLRVAAGVWHLHALRRSCTPFPFDQLDAASRETIKRCRTTRRVEICTSSCVSVPTAIGFMKPAVVIPAWLMPELSPAELNQVLLHELEHLRRRDDWTNLAQKVVKAIFFFHPAVWWIERRVSLEREMACDDAVLEQTANPHAYAECLTHLAEKSLIRRSLALAQAALGRIRQTSLRVARVLNSDRTIAAKNSWKAVVCVMASFAVASALFIARAPRLVSFEEPHVAEPSTVATSSSVSGSTLGRFIPAALRVPSGKTNSASQPRIVKAKARPLAVSSGQDASRSGILRSSPTANSSNMVHLTSFFSDSTFSAETVFVVVESNQDGASGLAYYQISVWHVTVPATINKAGSDDIPRKQT